MEGGRVDGFVALDVTGTSYSPARPLRRNPPPSYIFRRSLPRAIVGSPVDIFYQYLACNVSQGYMSHSLIPIRDTSGEYEIYLKNPGAGLLKEFYFNIASWFVFSINEPIQGLETLRIAENVGNAVHSLAKWLPFAPNLTELEITKDGSLFSVITESDERQSGGSIEAFLLPKLRTLNAPLHLLPYLTCPSLEKYVVDHDPLDDTQPYLLNFVERSACPLHTLIIKFTPSYLETSAFDLNMAQGFLVPRITTLVVVRPGAALTRVLSLPSEGGDGFSVLPALQHLEFRFFHGGHFHNVSTLITSRWDIPNARRSLKSVTLVRCFDFIPQFLSSPQSGAMIQMEEVEEKWRNLARCANEGLIFNVY
ncbi:hypothetical protein SCHPADRAFT_931624 [Schizopora paradoxa]|uniref:Uncharacterized protein n=1 Tax=Schizopora paradoxa TaxID=27342 RepID=A0A0H2RGR2_9AGAM|nr:hypothetical protein SCHPADRAFT_931624 [Schizopora paradoxa]